MNAIAASNGAESGLPSQVYASINLPALYCLPSASGRTGQSVLLMHHDCRPTASAPGFSPKYAHYIGVCKTPSSWPLTASEFPRAANYKFKGMTSAHCAQAMAQGSGDYLRVSVQELLLRFRSRQVAQRYAFIIDSLDWALQLRSV